MDRKLSSDEIRNRRLRSWIISGAVVVGIIALFFIVASLSRKSVKLSDLSVADVERGPLEISISASGKVVPAFEEIITSPIASRIEKVYCRPGDSVAAGTPLLQLDLEATVSQLSGQSDVIEMRRHEVEQQRINNDTRISDLMMQAEVKEMTLRRLEVELRNERYLDSIGSGTGDRVRQAELAVNTGRLELDQLRQLIANERRIADAALSIRELEHSVAARDLSEMRRTLDLARVTAPRSAIITYILDNVGEKVTEGQKLAVLSDLSHFKVDANIPDAYAEKIGVGSTASVVVGRNSLTGTVSNLTPLSVNGQISFSVRLDDDANSLLRSGLRTDVHIIYGMVDDALRIPRGPFYSGPGKYRLFVVDPDGNSMKAREVTLGEGNYKWVEVVAGLSPTDRVVISDMSDYRSNETLKIKK